MSGVKCSSNGFPGSRFWRWTSSALRGSPKFTTGFTIIETIVAIAILSVAIVAPMTLAQRGLNGAIYARDQVTAFYLAQEAIEYVRNVRDSNNFAGFSRKPTWLQGLDLCKAPNVCGIGFDNSVSSGFQIVGGCAQDPTLCRLTFNTGTAGTMGTGVYGDSGIPGQGPQAGGPWQSTIFTRTLQIEPFSIALDNDAAANITATVSWKSGTISRSLKLTEKIFDWYPSGQ